MMMVTILAAMPDVLQRVLFEHIADDRGRCWECRDSSGIAADWPCLTRMIAEEAERLANSRRRGSRHRLERSGFDLRAV